MLEIKELSVSYGCIHALQGISLKVEKGSIVTLVGSNGAGKTTMLRAVSGLLKGSGQIFYEGQDVLNRPAHELVALGIAHSPEGRMVFANLTVMENLLSGRLGYVPAFKAWLRRFPKADVDRAFALLDRVGLGSFANQRADALSGGQRQRVGIARAVMQGPRLLLADEPTSSLDPKTSVEIMELLREVGREHGLPVIVNMHDVELARRFAERIIGMSGGRVVYDGPPARLSDGVLKSIYGGESWLA
jgi:phosphonate transport system ATP-binding protein